MAKFSGMIFLNTYSDGNPSNSPDMNNFKWTRNYSGMTVANPTSQQLTLAPGETRSLFSGVRTLLQDSTTVYSIALKPLSSNTYILSATGGTLPNFRTPRVLGIDATTQITVTLNGPIATFTSTGGTALNTTTVQVGDYVQVGNLFNILNQGVWQVISKTANSLTINHEGGTGESSITLGSGFATQLSAFSAAGVQVGDTLVISGGFSPASWGSYEVTAVTANTIEFYETNLLPQESGIVTQAIAAYSDAKQLVYLEADSAVAVILNGVVVANITPFVVPGVLGATTQPGVFMLKSTVYSLSLQNSGINTANVFFAAVE